jgi:hypothetical protein
MGRGGKGWFHSASLEETLGCHLQNRGSDGGKLQLWRPLIKPPAACSANGRFAGQDYVLPYGDGNTSSLWIYPRLNGSSCQLSP